MPTTFSNPSFAQTVHHLTGHPVVAAMAAELLAAPADTGADFTNAQGGPTSAFAVAANAEFAKRSGTGGRFHGAVAHAVLARRAVLLDKAQAEERMLLAGALPEEVSEERAAHLEARMAIKDMWVHGFPRCPLTKYADTAGRLADRLAGSRS
ncbi:hypothetical protein ACFVHW_04280 [Streptomyces sp. NPDC127110]|uniref:hypothetical protein n=1 Tax=Streptomyces sp. NPDC127110 TaxID=3345362 RepID=UPI00362D1C8D